MSFIQPEPSLSAVAEAEVLQRFGDNVSVLEAGHTVHQYGKILDLDTGDGLVSIAEYLPSNPMDETYVSTNIIDSISSGDAGDNQTIEIEGHTISGGNFTFVRQTAVLNGQTRVALTTPLARVQRAYVQSGGVPVGPITVYEDTPLAAGVPIDEARIHVAIPLGDTESFKTALTTASNEYLFITQLFCTVLRGSTPLIEFVFEVSEGTGAGTPLFLPRLGLPGIRPSAQTTAVIPANPWMVIPPNSDVRMRALTTSNATKVWATMSGVYATIQP